MVEIFPVAHELCYSVSGEDTRLDTSGSDSVRDISQDATSVSASLSSLPPLFFEIILPPLYPSHSPAVITTVKPILEWIPVRMIGEMQRRMLEMWANMGGDMANGGGVGILYSWVEWVRSGEFLTEIGLGNSDGSVRYVPCTHSLCMPPILDL